MRGDLGYDTPQAQHKAQDILETCALLELHLEGREAGQHHLSKTAPDSTLRQLTRDVSHCQHS